MIKESYIDDVLDAIKKFYHYDGELLVRKPHEQTISFRIAKYLSESLEKGLFRVDCEFHGNLDENGDRRKEIPRSKCSNDKEKMKIRPDIIFHKRSKTACFGPNLFLIEVKKGSPNGDIAKVTHALNDLHYKQTFCIYNIKVDSVTVCEVNSNCLIKHKYKVESENDEVFLREVSNEKNENGN